MRFITIITQLQVTIAMRFQALTGYMNVNYVIRHGQESSILFHRIMSIMWVLIIIYIEIMAKYQVLSSHSRSWYFVAPAETRAEHLQSTSQQTLQPKPACSVASDWEGV
jgi:hypothetical protein